MAQLRGVSPAEAVEIENASLINVRNESDKLIYRNRAGEETEFFEFPEIAKKYVVRLGSFDQPSRDVVVPEWYLPFGLNASISSNFQPSEPIGNVHSISWLPDGRFAALAHSNPPYLTGYFRRGNRLIHTPFLAPDTSPPPTTPSVISWSPDGKYLAVGYVSASQLDIYVRTGTKISLKGTLPAPFGRFINDLAWSPDGRHLVVGHRQTPFITIYRVVNGGFHNANFNNSAVDAVVHGVSWSPDGKYLAIAKESPVPLLLFRADGETFVKMTDPPQPAGWATSVAWSPTGNHLAVGHSNFPRLTIYRRSSSGDLVKRLLELTQEPEGVVQSVSWSPDGRYLAVTNAQPTAVKGNSQIYSVPSSSSVIIRELPENAPSDRVSNDAAWSPDGRLLVLGYVPLSAQTTSGVKVFQAAGEVYGGVPFRVEPEF